MLYFSPQVTRIGWKCVRGSLECVFSLGEARAFFVKECHHGARKICRAGTQGKWDLGGVQTAWQCGSHPNTKEWWGPEISPLLLVPSLTLLCSRNNASHADLEGRLDNICAHVWERVCSKTSVKWPWVLLDIVYLLFITDWYIHSDLFFSSVFAYVADCVSSLSSYFFLHTFALTRCRIAYRMPFYKLKKVTFWVR